MPRKPQQSRSKATVNAILEGALRSIQRDGFEKLTTKSIADHGGVSIGSIYEYFEGKEEIIDALFMNFVEAINLMIDENREDLLGLPVDQLVESMLQKFGELLGRNQQTYFTLAQHLLHKNTEKYLQPVRDNLTQFVMVYLMRNPQYFKVKDLELMVFILINSGIFVVMRKLSGDGANLTLEQLGQGFGKLIKHYVQNENDD